MPRTREHDLDTLLDHARRLWVREGMDAVTIRALAAESGVSNGSIYNAFGSRATLLAQVWIRQADVFLGFQRQAAADHEGPADAVVAVALAPAGYAESDDDGARLLLGVRPDELLRAEVAEQQRLHLVRLRRELSELVTDLADRLWGRSDPIALALVRICVVDLPGRLLLSTSRPTDAVARHALRAAVRGITSTAPPPAPTGTGPMTEKTITEESPCPN